MVLFIQRLFKKLNKVVSWSSSPFAVGNRWFSLSPRCFNEANLVFRFDLSDSSKNLFLLEDGRSITYADFGQTVGRFAGFLRELGVKKGDRVASHVTKSPEAVALYLATLKIGAVYFPLNTDYQDTEMEYFLDNAEPKIFLSYRNSALSVAKSKLQCFPEKDFWQSAVKFTGQTPETEPLKPNDTAALLYTSGTTGKPKGAMISHQNLISNAESLRNAWEISESDVLLHILPLFHVHGLFVALNTSLLAHASVRLLPKFTPEATVKHFPKSTVMMGVPTHYTRLLNCAEFDKNVTRNIRLFVSGSAPLDAKTWNDFAQKTGHQILERYGMTEGQMVCSNPYKGERRPGTVGKPLPGIDVRIDPETGSLQYKGPNTFSGYWKLPSKTAEAFTSDGYFISGDRAALDPKTGYISLLGRESDMIIAGGLNIYPKEIEDRISCLAGVKECAVFGVPHSDFGEVPVAAVVPQEIGHLDEKQFEEMVTNNLQGQIAKFKIPKRVLFVDALPRNSMGKIQKNVLKKTYATLFH